MWYIWLIAAGVFFIAEIITFWFMIFWLGIAALIVCLLSLVIHNIFIQMAVFVVLSTLLLFLTRPFVEKFVIKKDEKTITNAFSIIGKEAKVIKAMDPVTKLGQVKIGQETWTARDTNEKLLQEGDVVKVKAIDGVKAIVSKV